jgi:hypothetical protein
MSQRDSSDDRRRAIALLTVLLTDDVEPSDDMLAAVVPDLDDADDVRSLLRGLGELAAWLVMQLEDASGTSAAQWLQRAALDTP